MKNEYIPHLAEIVSVRKETHDTKTYRLVFRDSGLAGSFDYKQGQFVQVSVLGVGEAPISITSSPSRKGFLELTLRAAGRVTSAICRLHTGDSVYIRGPYGNFFPFKELKGRDILFIAGGIGLAPVRSLINLVFDNRDAFGHITILYGAKTPQEICFKNELIKWEGIRDTSVFTTVDKPDGTWKGHTGVVTSLYDKANINSKNSTAVLCGPPVMIKFAAKELLQRGFCRPDIIVTLERYMKCGIGKCGHCNIGGLYVCTDGPVFTWDQVVRFPENEHVF
ncbi:MAG: hydrogenase [Spirochaetes bacterium]|nr:hydrogenase [Spirochaetota bacterium]